MRLHSRCKCKYCFMTKISGDTLWWKKNMDSASLQRQVLIWLQYKGKCWCSCMVKTLDVATLQRLLMWLHCKDKCWCSLIAKTKASTTSRSSTNNSIIVSWIPVITLLLKWLSLWECQRWISLRDCCCKHYKKIGLLRRAKIAAKVPFGLLW